MNYENASFSIKLGLFPNINLISLQAVCFILQLADSLVQSSIVRLQSIIYGLQSSIEILQLSIYRLQSLKKKKTTVFEEKKVYSL